MNDYTFALTRDQTGRYFGGVASTIYAVSYGCSATGVTVAGLLAGSYTAAGYANVNLSGTSFLPTISRTTCNGTSSCACSCQCNGPVVACPGLSLWTNSGAGYVQHTVLAQSMVTRSEGNCGGWTMSPDTNLLQLDGSGELGEQERCPFHLHSRPPPSPLSVFPSVDTGLRWCHLRNRVQHLLGRTSYSRWHALQSNALGIWDGSRLSASCTNTRGALSNHSPGECWKRICTQHSGMDSVGPPIDGMVMCANRHQCQRVRLCRHNRRDVCHHARRDCGILHARINERAVWHRQGLHGCDDGCNAARRNSCYNGHS